MLITHDIITKISYGSVLKYIGDVCLQAAAICDLRLFTGWSWRSQVVSFVVVQLQLMRNLQSQVAIWNR